MLEMLALKTLTQVHGKYARNNEKVEFILTPYSGLKYPDFSHHAYQAASVYLGLYASGMGPEISI